MREFIETAKRENADIIVASALMTTTMIYMPELIKQLEVALNASTDQITCGKGPGSMYTVSPQAERTAFACYELVNHGVSAAVVGSHRH